MSAVPQWVVEYLGKRVITRRELAGPCEVYPAGSVGVLVSIQAEIPGYQAAGVTVALDPNDLGYEENFGFDDIRPLL